MSRLVMKNFQRLARSFLAGILAVLPVVITVAIVAWAAGFVRKILGPGTLIGEGLTGLGLRFVTNDTVAYLIGGLLVLGCVLAIGMAVEAGAKNLVQRLLGRRHAADSDHRQHLRHVEAIGDPLREERPREAARDEGRLLLLRREDRGRSSRPAGLARAVSHQRRNYHIVIVPTSPVPVGGGLFFIPVEMVQPTDVSVEGLMSIYVSMGVSAPQVLPTS